MVGKIKNIVQERGFGFIRPDGGGADIFFHARQLVNGLGIDDLSAGDTVVFDTEPSDKGPRAVNVQRV